MLGWLVVTDRAWVSAFPPPTCAAVVSLPANLATAMVLLDYAAHGLATPTPWPQAALRDMPARALARLRRLRTVLAHGTVLREFVLDRLEPGHPAQRDWAALRGWVAGLAPGEVAGLIADGILLGLAYYREEMDPLPEVESILARLGTRDPGRGLLDDAAARRLAAEALLVSWGVREIQEPLELALEPEGFREELLALLDDLWDRAFARAWQQEASRLEAAAARAERLALQGPARAAGERILEVTGLQPPLELEGVLRRASHLLFVPCLHLGRYLALTRAGVGWVPARFGPDRFRVFFEPGPAADAGAGPSRGAQVIELGHLAPALGALGDATRLAIVQLLRDRGEMFAGQLAEELRVHPSTVSRHVAELEAAGLVRVRREGNVKYYRLDRERLRAVARLLEDALG